MGKLKMPDAPAGEKQFLTAALACLTRGIAVTLCYFGQLGVGDTPSPQQLCEFQSASKAMGSF